MPLGSICTFKTDGSFTWDKYEELCCKSDDNFSWSIMLDTIAMQYHRLCEHHSCDKYVQENFIYRFSDLNELTIQSQDSVAEYTRNE